MYDILATIVILQVAGLIYPGNSGQDPQVADAWCRPLTVYKKKNVFRLSFSKDKNVVFVNSNLI